MNADAILFITGLWAITSVALYLLAIKLWSPKPTGKAYR